MNVVDLLLQADEGVFELPTKEIAMNRLSKVLGQEVKFKVTALTNEQYKNIQECSVVTDVKNKTVDIDANEMAITGVIEGTIEPNFKDEKLRKHYKCKTNKELVEKLLLPGEIIKLFEQIGTLSGIGEEEKKSEKLKEPLKKMEK